MSETIEPAEVFHIGEFLCDEMEAREWTTADVARRMPGDPSRNQMMVDVIICVRRPGLLIGDDTFAALAQAFDISEQYLRGLDAEWRKYPDRIAAFEPPESIFLPHLYDLNLPGAPNA